MDLWFSFNFKFLFSKIWFISEKDRFYFRELRRRLTKGLYNMINSIKHPMKFACIQFDYIDLDIYKKNKK